MNLPELTFAEFGSKPMQLVIHLNGQKENYLHRACTEIGVSVVTITKKDKYGRFTQSRTGFFLDGYDGEFDTADQVYVAYMHKVCGVPYDRLA